MTQSILILSSALFLFAGPGNAKTSPKHSTTKARPTAKIPLSTAKPTHKKPVKTLHKAKPKTKTRRRKLVKGKRGRKTVFLAPTLVRPNFHAPISPEILARIAEQRATQEAAQGSTDVRTPMGGDSPVTTLATLDPGHARQGQFAIDFRCGFVHTQLGAGQAGYAVWPNWLIDRCNQRGGPVDPGVEVSFPVEAGRAYVVDCNSAADTRFNIKYKFDGGDWSSPASIRSADPNQFLVADADTVAHVRFHFDPENNHILQQSIRNCRVNRIGD